ncbi:MAG: DUF3991 domain-containing protein [Clostridia bacterium]|nr:DUF3991 domain-containing protein [Clostridia bacterium]
MAYIYFTEEEKHRANATSLVDYLRNRGEKLIRSGSEYRLVYFDSSGEHDSITIKGNEWYDHSAEEGGMAPKFLQRFYGMDYPAAVTELLGGETGSIDRPIVVGRKEKARKPFVLPEANSNMRRVFAYLLKQRCIDPEVLEYFVHNRLIYESREQVENGQGEIREYHNLIFVGMDENGVSKHAHKRSVNSFGNSLRLNIEGSDPGYSFHYIGNSETLYVFEAPIDMLSYLSLHKENWRYHSYVALCGVSEHAMLKMLELQSILQRVVLCVDHDERGIEASGRLKEVLREKGYIQIEQQLSSCKDWNEVLKAYHGLTAIPAEEHPQLVILDEVRSKLAGFWEKAPLSECTVQRIEYYLDQVSSFLSCDKFQEAAEAMEKISVTALKISQNKYRQVGNVFSLEQMLSELCQGFQPHKSRSHIKHRLEDLKLTACSLSVKRGAMAQVEFLKQAGGYRKLAQESFSTAVWIEAELKWQKELQTEAETETEQHPVMKII